MRFFVRVKPNAKEEKVTGEGTNFTVAVKAPPREGKANTAVIAALAAHFNVPKSQVNIVAGHVARHKVIEISP
ncbi:MAG: DUF167 domain-containing protein [Candidatus Brennerbacteria bacterium]|nr:DUF167 domain-containing protein [Candidatus Brennerbacteria bacterium]